METLVYSSTEKYLIIDIKNLLNENNIPVSSIQLYIKIDMSRYSRGIEVKDIREERGELKVPIEEFDENLNNAEMLEIYAEEEYYDKAINLIEEWEENNFYKYCIFKSNDYNEAFTVQRLLNKNDIPCDEVFTNITDDYIEEYLIFLDPKFHEQANNLLKNDNKQKIEIEDSYYKKERKDKIYEQEINENSSLRYIIIILLVIIIIFILLYKFKNNIPIIDNIYNAIIEKIINKT